LLSFIAPPEYSRALPIAFITAASTVPLSITQAMTSISLAKERTRATCICGIAIAIVTVTVNGLFVPKLGALFAAVTSAVGFLLLAISGTVSASRAVGKSLIGLRYAFAIPCIIIIGTLAVYAAGVCSIVRYFILAAALLALCVTLYKNRYLLSENIKAAPPF
jgi:O-antigen/teichoic acid export membrane protein